MAKDETLVAETPTESAPAIAESSARFTKALDDAKAGASALGKSVQDKTAELRGKLGDKWADKSVDLVEEAKAISADAKVRAAALASDGKARASDALSSLGKLVADNSSLVDDKLGAKYGDYTRTAARHIQETAAKLDSKDLDELGTEAKEFVRKNPGVAVGLAAVAGFFIARMLKKSDD